jgi:hypothetical protein
MPLDPAVPLNVEKVGGGQIRVPNDAVGEMVENRQRPKRLQRPPTLLERMLQRSGAVAPAMPSQVREKAPKRVQEAMKVVEEYVADLESGRPVQE